METKLHISRASGADAQEIYALYHSLIDMPHSTWDEDYPALDMVEHDLEHNQVLVMREGDGRIVSAIVIAQDEEEEFDGAADWYQDVARWAALARLGVARDMQGRGIAKRMLEAAMALAREQGVQAVRFLVAKDNPYPQRAYAKLNFDICGETEMFDWRWLCYQKRL